ncbi:MAG: hypothetical protein QM711_03975 [Micropruina sp.]|uniref:hypothetical protein n=1 Tax=Micropruina sp. TaxID=2737536 RepID=UPI0039E45C3B
MMLATISAATSLALHHATAGTGLLAGLPFADPDDDKKGVIGTVCPKAPPGAQAPVNDILGNILWGVGVLFWVGVVVTIGAIVAGRVFNMPHASKVGVIGLIIIFVAAIGYQVAPGIVGAILGNGCISG